MALGLTRVMGKETLYLNMLRMFVAGQADTSAHIRALLVQGDTATAERLAHTLRGVAGNIGASALQQSATALELALRAGDPLATIDTLVLPVHRQLVTLVEALGRVLDSLAPRESAPVAVGVGIGPGLSSTYRQLQELLLDADSDSVVLFDLHQAEFKAALGPAFGGINNAIRSYDCDQAILLLQTALGPQPV